MALAESPLLNDELDQLPSVLAARRRRRVAARGDRGDKARRIDVAGVRGSADAAVIAALAANDARIVVVAEDSEAATRLAGDVAFLLGKKGGDEEDEDGATVLVLAMPDASPYSDLNPDRRGAMGRMRRSRISRRSRRGVCSSFRPPRSCGRWCRRRRSSRARIASRRTRS